MNPGGVLLGSHDVRQKWLLDMKKASGGKVSMTPRVIFESWSPQDWIKVFKEPKSYTMKVVAALVNEAQKHGLEAGIKGPLMEEWCSLSGVHSFFCGLCRYDGFVLEIWLQASIELGLLRDETAQSQIRQELVKFIARLGNMLDFKGLKSILVVPNPQIAPSQKEVCRVGTAETTATTGVANVSRGVLSCFACVHTYYSCKTSSEWGKSAHSASCRMITTPLAMEYLDRMLHFSG